MMPIPHSPRSTPVAPSTTCPPRRLDGPLESVEAPRVQRQPIAICELHPTQMTVGFREVAERRRRWRAASVTGEGAVRCLIVPVVLGPCGRRFILDRHHELCALAAERVTDVQVAVVDDLQRFEWVGFWRTLDRRGWCRARDSEGQRQDYSYIPTTINGLTDDPFRSLARVLRRAGGYAKQKAPFSDFLWADFLRQRLSRRLVNDDFEAALQEALALARNSGPTVSIELQNTRIDLRRKRPELRPTSSAIGRFEAVSTEASQECSSAEHGGAVR